MNPLTTKLTLLLTLVAAAPAVAQTKTQLLNSGSMGAKKDLVIIGDGFRAVDQPMFNAWVDNTVMNGLFQQDVFRDSMNAFNVWRININSVDAGVTQVNSSGIPTQGRNTALNYFYSGLWSRLWMEPGPNTETLLSNALAATGLLGAEYVFVVLNEPGGGGNAGGNRLAVTTAAGWGTCAHEMGHMIGGLGDEYTNSSWVYTGAEPTVPNLTKQTDRLLIKWWQYIPPWRPLPTLTSQVGDTAHDVGLFAGGTIAPAQWGDGLYRPTVNGRMNSNAPEFGPVCYAAFRDALDGFEARSFLRTHAGSFDGDSRHDILVQNGNSVQLFLSDGSRMIPTWGYTHAGNSGTALAVADFDGDGKDDFFRIDPGTSLSMFRSSGTSFSNIKNYTNSLPGWQFSSGDRFLVGDWNGDGRSDLLVYNLVNWSIPYMGFYVSNGSSLGLAARYDGALPGWQMASGDKYHVGDFDGDGMDEIVVFNGTNWSSRWFGLFRSTGNGIAYVTKYQTSFAGWTMAAHDQHFVGDFDNDGRSDVYTWNGTDWSIRYLGMMRSFGTGFSTVAIYNGSVPGWNLGSGDTFTVGDVNGDGKDDLVAINTSNYSIGYLGIFRSTGTGVTATWQSDWIGGWRLSPGDAVLLANFSGDRAGAEDVIIRNINWLGLMRSNSSSFSLVRNYPKYIRNVPFHAYGWW